ncbi:head-tail adaptor protein [Amaricoccus macauensis]|uniref:head-tail adaptor protein n=1 Tax=Amaricoccus macauensis TaxID=57001 RepID=UPI003C7A625A
MISPVTLSRNLILEEPRPHEDGTGGFAMSWTEVGRLWAQVEARKGRETVEGARTRSRIPYRIVVRAAPVGAKSRPIPSQRFRDGGRIFEILSVAEVDPRGRYLEIYAEEGVQL